MVELLDDPPAESTSESSIPAFQTSRSPDPDPKPTNSASSDSSDWEGWRAAELDPGGGAEAVILDADEPGPGEPKFAGRERMSKEAFRLAFSAAWSFPGSVDPDFKPLEITPEKQHGADTTADVIYELLEQFYPAALYQFDERWMRYAVAGGFIWSQYKIGAAILAQKRLAVSGIDAAGAAPADMDSDPIAGFSGVPRRATE